MTNLERIVEDLRIKFRLLFNQIHNTTDGILNYYNLAHLEATKSETFALQAKASADSILSIDLSTKIDGVNVRTIMKITRIDFNNLVTKDTNTVYLIVG